MSKFIFVCNKKPENEKEKVEKICNSIKPDNLSPNKSTVYADNTGITFGVFNPNEANLIRENNICLGYTESENWHRVGESIPTGNFSIVRSNEEYVEFLTDILATRSIWYVHTNEYFIASSSQRMLIAYLGSYIPNENAISCMLASGNLGYGNSWDKRIKCIPADTKLRLDRSTWEINTTSIPVEFKVANNSYSAHKENLKSAIKHSIESFNIDLSKWALPLSGGYDSRGILLNIDNKKDLNAITWGLESSIHEVGSDAYIASEISEKFGMSHKYYPTDFSEESVKIIFNRFLRIGEGRSDNVGGYLDGFSVWNTLFDENYLGIIRGDEGFGWVRAATIREARVKNGISFLSDYDNLKPFTEELKEVEIPEILVRKKNESIATWRDRLYHQFHIPTILAGLNDLKLSHVELITPLLSRNIILTTRTLPDKLRTDKKLFKNIVDSYKIGIPYAKYGSNMKMQSIFKQEEVVNEIKEGLQNSTVLPENLRDYILDNINYVSSNSKKYNVKEDILKKVKASLPAFVIDLLKRNTVTNIDINMLGFRAYIIITMDKMLKEDSSLLKRGL